MSGRAAAVPDGSALALCQRAVPGHRPGLLALIAWQGVRGSTRFSGPPAAIGAQAQPAPPVGRPVQGRSVRLHDATSLGWRAASAADHPDLLGHLASGGALPADGLWVDLALAVHRNGRWLSLDVDAEFLHGALGHAADGGSPVWLPADADEALAALDTSAEHLRRAASCPDAVCWALRADGLGMFISGLIDLGWEPAG